MINKYKIHNICIKIKNISGKFWANFYRNIIKRYYLKCRKLHKNAENLHISIDTVLPSWIRGGKATRLKYKEIHEHDKVSNM